MEAEQEEYTEEEKNEVGEEEKDEYIHLRRSLLISSIQLRRSLLMYTHLKNARRVSHHWESRKTFKDPNKFPFLPRYSQSSSSMAAWMRRRFSSSRFNRCSLSSSCGLHLLSFRDASRVRLVS